MQKNNNNYCNSHSSLLNKEVLLLLFHTVLTQVLFFLQQSPVLCSAHEVAVDYWNTFAWWLSE